MKFLVRFRNLPVVLKITNLTCWKALVKNRLDENSNNYVDLSMGTILQFTASVGNECGVIDATKYDLRE